jgi:hypothetical protein
MRASACQQIMTRLSGLSQSDWLLFQKIKPEKSSKSLHDTKKRFGFVHLLGSSSISSSFAAPMHPIPFELITLSESFPRPNLGWLLHFLQLDTISKINQKARKKFRLGDGGAPKRDNFTE